MRGCLLGVVLLALACGGGSKNSSTGDSGVPDSGVPDGQVDGAVDAGGRDGQVDAGVLPVATTIRTTSGGGAAVSENFEVQVRIGGVGAGAAQSANFRAYVGP